MFCPKQNRRILYLFCPFERCIPKANPAKKVENGEKGAIRLVARGIIKGSKGPFFSTLLTPRNKSIFDAAKKSRVALGQKSYFWTEKGLSGLEKV
jgi:hypothetical protein